MTYIKDIKNIVSKHTKSSCNINIEPIGNHEIGRHLVYKTEEGKNKYVFKSYYRNDKRERELNSLEFLKNCDVNVPKVIDFGEYNNHQWILMEYIDGEVFEHIYLNLDMHSKLKLFSNLGECLGKIHSYKIFDYALDWNKSIRKEEFKLNKIKKFEERVIEIEKQNSPYKELLFSIMEEIRKNFEELFSIERFRFTHNDFDGRNVLVKSEKGVYIVQAIIDFEQSYPDDYCNDLANLYFKYFMENKDYEKAFLHGYNKYMTLDNKFYDILRIYLMLMIVEHCSWSYEKANDYYMENIEFLKRFLIK
ncbi:aminoglycoside phosphotransferase family protein [Clostridium sp.]|uniref:phosphotransferase enzyme family protein n=1 Tax=Clostridium sp. TaxID=1506 RepID=UPI002603CC03|nr:aminoglycoside phosphotransferase family protein [Clostridium sp.]